MAFMEPTQEGDQTSKVGGSLRLRKSGTMRGSSEPGSLEEAKHYDVPSSVRITYGWTDECRGGATTAVAEGKRGGDCGTCH